MPALVVVVTGGIGSGKSTLVDHLERHGAAVIDVDALGRSALEPGGGAHQDVIDAFGPTVVDEAGRIDRAALAAIVFADAGALARLNAISHPVINQELEGRIQALPPDEIVVLDMAVFVESSLGQGPSGPLYDLVVTVEAPVETRIERLEGRGMDAEAARARIRSQADDRTRRAASDIVIDNSGPPGQMEEAAGLLWSDLVGRATGAVREDREDRDG